MRQAIVTKFLGPTDHRGSRIKATAEAGSITVSWDHGLGVEENHLKAATALAWRFGWLDDGSKLHGGTLPSNDGYAFVMVAPPAIREPRWNLED
jgi:hypothetical protein